MLYWKIDELIFRFRYFYLAIKNEQKLFVEKMKKFTYITFKSDHKVPFIASEYLFTVSRTPSSSFRRLTSFHSSKIYRSHYSALVCENLLEVIVWFKTIKK